MRKTFYDYRQAPRAWYNKIEFHFYHDNFEKCPDEHTLFVKHNGDIIQIVSLYVYTLIYTSNNDDMFEYFKESIERKFAMTDLAKMRYILGVEVKKENAGIFIH